MRKVLSYTIIAFSAIACSKLEIVRVDAKIDSITPDTAVPGSILTIAGSNFTETTVVTIGPNEVDLVSVEGGQIRVEIPLSLDVGNYEVTVTSRGQPALASIEVLPFFAQKTVHPIGFPGNVNPSGFVLDNRVYLGTREVTTSPIDDFYVYQPESDDWGRLDTDNDLPFGTGEIGFTVGNKGYLRHNGAIWEYDPASNLWTQLSSIPIPSSVALVVGTNVYLVQDDFFGNAVWRYSVPDDEWTQMNDFEGPMRAGSMGFVIDGVAYLGQGLDRDLNDLFNDLWRYNEDSDTWSEMASPAESTGIQYGVGFSLNGKGYFGLGRTSESVATFYQYNPETDSWRAISDLPAAPRVFTRAFVANDKVYLMYGSDEVGSNNGDRVDEVWEFTPESF